ncbi:hypothetical protein [Pseudomonas putida]|uniref:hypothetical protein n=1 Tax=Pseudomonas putida TaxID=303 RepID=UPI0013CF18FE|nr:hypothetical protein [Pseudomonas putida]
MFYLDKNAALSSSLPCGSDGAEAEALAIWRYISKRYKKKNDGSISAKPSAFNIRRDEGGKPKEPSASLFELSEDGNCTLENAVRVTGLLITTKNFKRVDALDASGSLIMADVMELNRDPRAFKVFKTPGQKKGVLLHWDLEYELDDREPEMLIAKSALAHICRVYVCGGQALKSVALLQQASDQAS